MYEAMMIAATGLKNQQARLDTIANNVANVNSAAFKGARLDFRDALYTAGIVPGLPRTRDGNQQQGHGVMVAGITKDYSMGSLQTTGRDLDTAIEGEGFFELEDSNGATLYTRNGSFNIGKGDTGDYLVSADGYYIHDTNGARIQIPNGTSAVSIGEDGTITFTAGDQETSVKLGLYTFRNITGLMTAGNGNYSESVSSGAKLQASGAAVRQGVIEISNVKLSEEMTRLIRTQRAFQLSSRALRTADDMEGLANNMRK